MKRKFDEVKMLFLKARATKNFNDMVVWATELLMMDDSLAYVWANRGVGLAGMGHFFDAILSYDRAIPLQKDETELAILYSNKGAAYWDMGNAERALSCLTRATHIQPLAQTYMTLGNVYKYQGHLEKAISAYRSSIDTDPLYADGHLMLGMALLKNGALQEGWREYEWRWKTEQLPARKLKCPQWNGEDLTNKIILVYGEQGLGDIIQFSRYAGILGKRFPSCKIILEGRPEVKRLLETMPNIYSVINVGDRLPELDYGVPMLTLAGLLTPSISSIPSVTRQFLIKPDDVKAWEGRLLPLTSRAPSRVKVGICWAGMSRDSHPSARAIDELRSTTLSTFFPLTKVEEITWVSLQKGPPKEQLREQLPEEMLVGDFTADMFDFYDTACAIANCDLVIAVDTAVAHVAASIGKPTWLLSRWDGCWRWFGDREDSPWYPSLKQFVQPSPHDWESMIKNVKDELVEFVQNKKTKEVDLTLAK